MKQLGVLAAMVIIQGCLMIHAYQSMSILSTIVLNVVKANTNLWCKFNTCQHSQFNVNGFLFNRYN